jgi:hypothetical protein
MQQPGVRRQVEAILYTKALNGRDQPGSCARSGLVNLRPAIPGAMPEAIEWRPFRTFQTPASAQR